MRAFLVVAWVSVVGCGKSPQQLCTDSITAQCMRQLQCLGTAVSQDMCIAMLMANNNNCMMADHCPTGTTYDPNKAGQCANDWAGFSCTDLAAGNLPVSCGNACH
jgi:hypothetical protein